MKDNLLKRYRAHILPSFLLGCAIGFVFFTLIYGLSIVVPTNVNWLLHSDDLEGSVDLTQHYLGWVFYRNSPWHFPFGLTDGIYSTPISVIYTDSIPLFAFIFKLLSPILPEAFQYFGLYGLISYCLTGGFAVILTRRYSDNPILHIVAAFIFVSNPVLLNRMYLHTALAGHFLIVAALCLYFYHRSLSEAKRITLWSILITCGTLINAYFAPMLFGFLFFAILSDATTHRVAKSLSASSVKVEEDEDIGIDTSAIDRLLLLFTPAAITGIMCFCFGMFYGHVPSASGGLEVLSFNLNGFFNPMTKLTAFKDHNLGYTDMNYSMWLPSLPMVTAYQNEGFSYLGVGAIALLLSTIISAVSSSAEPQRRDTKTISTDYLVQKSDRDFLFLFMLVCLFFALSPVATFGEKILYQLPLPEFIHNLWSSFRSTARFIWPVYYTLLAMPFLYFGRIGSKEEPDKKRLGTVIFFFILIFAGLLQFFDLTPGYIIKHNAFSNITPYESKLSDPAWERLGKTHKRIVFYPPTEYGLYVDGKTSVEFEIYALKHGLTLNNSYMSRNLCDVADALTIDHFASRAEGQSYPDILYIFFDCVKESELPDPETYHLTYKKLNGYTVGTEE